jgi:hypothetical protein
VTSMPSADRRAQPGIESACWSWCADHPVLPDADIESQQTPLHDPRPLAGWDTCDVAIVVMMTPASEASTPSGGKVGL